MNLKKGIMAFTLAGCLLSGGVIAEAGTTWSSTQYADVPGVNGSAYSGTQTKARTNASSDLAVSSISVRNKLDTRTIGGGRYGVVSGAWVRDTNVGSYAIPNPTVAGYATQLQFSSDFLSTGVQLGYKWRSN